MTEAQRTARIAGLLWSLNHDGAGRPVRETLRIERELVALGYDFAAAAPLC